MKPTYTISELARDFGVTTRTIRHYEDQGLICPARAGTARTFSNRDRVRLKLALRGKRLGFTLAQLRELFNLWDLAQDSNQPFDSLLGQLERHRGVLERQREDIEVMLSEIAFFVSQCRRTMAQRSAQSSVPSP